MNAYFNFKYRFVINKLTFSIKFGLHQIWSYIYMDSFEQLPIKE